MLGVTMSREMLANELSAWSALKDVSDKSTKCRLFHLSHPASTSLACI